MHHIHYVIRRIVDANLPTVRDLETGTARAATAAELLNMGIATTLDPEHYSCIEPYRFNYETNQYEVDGHHPVGDLVAHGPNRYATLPDDVRDRILLARVVVATAEGVTPLSLAASNLAEQLAAIDENVGTVDGAPLVDLSTDMAHADEARRLARIQGSGLSLTSVPRCQIDVAVHVVDADNLEPHRWAGERLPAR